MTKHTEWLAQHPTAAIVYEPCSFCPGMARYSLNIVHGMTETAPVTSCGSVGCLLRLYLIFTAQDEVTRSVANSGRITDVCSELLHVEVQLIEKVASRIGADYQPAR